MTEPSFELVIIGGGLIGLSCALHVAGTCSIAIVGGGEVGRASSAAAGMLTPACEWDPWMPAEFTELLVAGRDYFPEFLARFGLRADDVGYSERDFLMLDLLENPSGLQARFEGLLKNGVRADYVDRKRVFDLEPGVEPDAIRGAILIRGDGLINPRALHAQLAARLERTATTFASALERVEKRTRGFRLVLEDGRAMHAERVVIAAGAWSLEVGELFGLHVPTSPVRGQIVELKARPGLVRSVVYMPAGGCGCLLERTSGSYITGTSEECTQPVAANTSQVVAAILSRLNRAFVFGGEMEISGMWSGFRPITPDELPLIGPSEDPRVYVAAGHHRNGVLLSALTGAIVGAALFGQVAAPRVDITPFRLNRQLRPQLRLASRF